MKTKTQSKTKISRNRQMLEIVLGNINTRSLPPRILPSFHYQIQNNDPIKILDKLGLILQEKGLELDLENSYGRYRWYVNEENFVYGGTGSPITTVNSFINFSPEYTEVREDGTNNTVKLPHGEVITVDLRVTNPADMPTLAMCVFGKMPIYDKIRKELFKFAEKHPFLEHKKYIDFIKKYEDIDSWLVVKDK